MMFSVLFAFVALVHASELNASDSLTDSSADTVPSNPDELDSSVLYDTKAGSSVRGYPSTAADAYASLSMLQEFMEDTKPAVSSSSIKGYPSTAADAYSSLSVLQEFMEDTKPAVSSSSIKGYPSSAADAYSSVNLLKEFIKDTEPLTLGPQETPKVDEALEVGTERSLYDQVLREEFLVASLITAILAILLAYFAL